MSESDSISNAERDAGKDALEKAISLWLSVPPPAYRRRVGALAILGYGYILAVAFFAPILAAALIFGILHQGIFSSALSYRVVLLVVAGYFSFRALSLKTEEPAGLEVTRGQVPELFDTTRRICEQLGVPGPHKVLLTSGMEPSILQVPRAGLLGAPRRYLLLGISGMCALPPEEYECLLVRQLSHFSSGRARLSARVFRARQSWTQILTALEKEKEFNFLFTPFFRWYAPYFHSFTAFLCRQEVLEADRMAARICGSALTARAITRLQVMQCFLDNEFWPAIQQRSQTYPHPPRQVFHELQRALHGPQEPSKLQGYANICWGDAWGTLEEPPLSQRMRALGQIHYFEPLAGTDAADRFLGGQSKQILEHFSERWHIEIEPQWKDLRRKWKQLRARTRHLNSTNPEEDAEPVTLWQLAQRQELEGQTDQAYAGLRALADQCPENALAHLALGRVSLKLEDEYGLHSLERALQIDEHLTEEACSAATSYLLSRGRYLEADLWIKRANQYQDKAVAAHAERNTIQFTDRFLPHGLSPEELTNLREALQSHLEIDKVLVVRKRLKYFPDQPLLIVGLSVRHKRFSWFEEPEIRAGYFARARDQLPFPMETRYVWLGVSENALWHAMEQVAGAQVYCTR